MKPSLREIEQQVSQALDEDLGSGDLTAALVPQQEVSSATVIVRQSAVIAGVDWFNEVFRQLDDGIAINWLVSDGEQVSADTVLCTLKGNSRHLLTGERSALNFLQTLSAVATRTRQFVDAVSDYGTRILDTRKTIPGLRLAQKYAVTCGGGANHRIGLYDAILIKENHIEAAGSIANAMQKALELVRDNTVIEIEVEDVNQMQQALDAGARHMLLDNFSLKQLSEAVALNDGRARLEASGNVSLETIASIAATGVDDISVGELTKHINAIDLSMRF